LGERRLCTAEAGGSNPPISTEQERERSRKTKQDKAKRRGKEDGKEEQRITRESRLNRTVKSKRPGGKPGRLLCGEQKIWLEPGAADGREERNQK
jgi:hypothetical protein